MKIIKVIPISRGIFKDSLSYFASGNISPGFIVDINLRGKIKKALVVEVVDAREEKASIKEADFSLKKLENAKGKLITSEAFSKSVLRASKYFATTSGAIFYELLPKFYFELENFKINTKNIEKSSKKYHEKLLLQAPEEDRISQYKGLIREELASRKSVFIVSPTVESSNELFGLLSKGIESFSFNLNSSLKEKDQVQIFKDIINSEKPVAVFITTSFLSIPRLDLGLIIFDKESSEYFKKDSRPFIDFRKFGEFLAEESNARILFGDIYPRTETLWREKKQEIHAIVPLKSRLSRDVITEVVDMKTNKKFQILDKETLSSIDEFLKKDKKIFIYTLRRGLYPITLCNDCGTTVKCEKCDSPAVLHKANSGNFFLCHKCGRGREAEDRCKFCGGWKLNTLGIGSSLIEDDIKRYFKGVKIFRLDSDSAKTKKKAEEIINNFHKNKKAVLIGTKKAVNYLKDVDLSVIASIDSFFSIPDFRINEHILFLLLDIRNKTKERIYIQTRNAEDPTLNYFKSGSLLDFYRQEIKDRERFKFPPFSRLIKLTYSGDKVKVKKISKELEILFKGYDFFTYPSFVSKIKGKIIYNGLIRLDADNWPNESLLSKILSLSPSISVDVDPESVL